MDLSPLAHYQRVLRAAPASRGRSVVANSPVKNALGERMRDTHASAAVKLVAGMAGGLAEAVTLQPLDVTKTRLQLDKTGKYKVIACRPRAPCLTQPGRF